jgi:hypothetical protein
MCFRLLSTSMQYLIHYLQTMIYIFICKYKKILTRKSSGGHQARNRKKYIFICDDLKEVILGTWGSEELRTLDAVIVSNM